MKGVVLALSMTSALFAPAVGAQTLKLAGVEAVEPLIYFKDGQLGGLDYDIWVELAKRVGLKADIELLPFRRLWGDLQSGKLDGALQIYYNADRERQIIYSKTPMHWSAHYIFVRKEDLPKYKTNSIDALYGKTVGRNTDFFVTPEFEAASKAGKFQVDDGVASTELNLAKLASGRVDCYVGNLHSAMYAIKKMGLQDRVVPLPKAFAEKKGTFFAISKQGKNIPNKEAFMERIDIELAKMHADGTVDRLWAKYSK